MSIVPQPPPNYSLKFLPEVLAAGYPPAEWKLIGKDRDHHGEYISIIRNGVEVKLHGSIGSAWIALLWEDRGAE